MNYRVQDKARHMIYGRHHERGVENASLGGLRPRVLRTHHLLLSYARQIGDDVQTLEETLQLSSGGVRRTRGAKRPQARRFQRLDNTKGLFIALALLLFTLFAPNANAEIVVGSKKFTESDVLGEIAARQMQKAGLDASLRKELGGTVIVWGALQHGDIAAYPEYSATISEEILKDKTITTNDGLKMALAKLNVGMTDDLGFNDNYALVMQRDRAAQYGIKTISDLAKHPELRAGPTPEFLNRKDGWKPLSTKYGININDVRGIEHGLGYAALRAGQIDVKDCYTTDAKIAEYNLVILEDDLHYFPTYRAVYLYRLDMDARAVAALRQLEGKISQERMIQLNAKAEATKDYAVAALDFFTNPTGANEPTKNAVPPRESSRYGKLIAELPRLTYQHLTLVLWSMLAAILVGIPLGIAASKPGAVSQVILGVTGIFQTIPSLALLALFIPIFGIGSLTAIIALFLYSLLPIVRNTATGLQDIPPALRESAAAMGLESTAQLRKVYLPLASRSILAGIKTSAIINVGTATLAGLIGAGGFGEPIQSGLQLNDKPTILQGAIPAAVLALLVQFGFDLLDRVIIPKGLRLPTNRS